MKWKFFIGLFFVLVFCLGSSGILVVQHQCALSGENTSHFFHYEHSCAPNEVVAECDIERRCCSPSLSEIIVLQKDCCAIEAKLFQVSGDYTAAEKERHKIDVAADEFPMRTQNGYCDHRERRFISCNHPPPYRRVLKIQQRLAFFQQYLI